ncbi:hypothetical protein ACFV4X_21570 [Streptomyces ardesiacus]|uniref:hypothetical protein n=1 Tax=Streptomyces ardesiacus TaxID=285564 RepID=UPI00364D71C7
MNWADLLEALLFAGLVLPLLLAVFRLIPLTASLVIQTTALTLMTLWYFLRGDAGGTVWYASLTVFFLLMLRHDHRRRSKARRDQDRAPSKDRARSTEQVHVITTLK